MNTDTPKPRVGLLALTLELYETLVPQLRPDRENWLRRALLPALDGIADVHFEQAVFRREDIEAAVQDFRCRGVDVLLVICLTYSPSQLALRALQHTDLPIVVWNTQELFAVDETLDGEKMIANHGVHGTQDLCNVLLRSGVRFEYVTSHLDDADGLAPLDDALAAAAAVSRLRRARLGLMGHPFPAMGDLGLDTTHLAATLGCQWFNLPVADFNERAECCAQDAVIALAEDYRQSYAVADDVTDKDLNDTARAELALRAMVEEHRLDAISYQFMALGDDGRTVTLPFVAASRLMAEGVGFGGEGDLIAAAGSWFLNQLASPASFSEIFTINFKGNGMMMSHMGEANLAMSSSGRKIPLVARSQGITRTVGRQLALVVSLRPGPATLCCLTMGPASRWRFVTSRVEIEDFGPLASMQVPHFNIRCLQDVRQWLTAYAKAGGAHHNAICFGDATKRISSAAAMLNADYIEI